MTTQTTPTVPAKKVSDDLYELVRMMRENRGERCAALVMLERAIDELLDGNPTRFTAEHRDVIDRLQRVRLYVAVDDLEDHVERLAMDLPRD